MQVNISRYEEKEVANSEELTISLFITKRKKEYMGGYL